MCPAPVYSFLSVSWPAKKNKAWRVYGIAISQKDPHLKQTCSRRETFTSGLGPCMKTGPIGRLLPLLCHFFIVNFHSSMLISFLVMSFYLPPHRPLPHHLILLTDTHSHFKTSGDTSQSPNDSPGWPNLRQRGNHGP